MNDRWLKKGVPAHLSWYWPVKVTTVLYQRAGALGALMAHVQGRILGTPKRNEKLFLVYPSAVNWKEWFVVSSVLSAARREGRAADCILTQWRVRETDISFRLYQPMTY